MHPIDQVTKQLHKLVNVIKIRDLEPADTVARELALFKVSADGAPRRGHADRGDLPRQDHRRHAPLVIIEVTGTWEKIEAFERMVRPFGLVEMARTGEIAISRGPRRDLTVSTSVSWGRGTGGAPPRRPGAWTARSSCRAPRRWRRTTGCCSSICRQRRSPDPGGVDVLRRRPRARGVRPQQGLTSGRCSATRSAASCDAAPRRLPGSATRVIASCTDADEEPAPGASEPSLRGPARDGRGRLRARVEHRERRRPAQVWLDLLPFFAPTAAGVEAVREALAGVVFRPEGMREHDLGELHGLTALATSDIPVLAIVGEQDRGTPPEAARRIAATAPRGELVVLDGVGHFPFAEAPDAYWGAVRGWLERTG
jgi:pimeloyl-ACP methyl ester carboxylesterase